LSNEFDPTEPATPQASPNVWIFAGLTGIVVLGLASFIVLRPSASPPPEEIANDPLLVQGRVVYLDRCASCHGQLGKGDGPTARGLAGPPVGDLSDDKWKHGDKTEQVLGVIRMGVKETAMPAWGNLISENSQKAVTAYVYHLAGQKVPEVLREPAK
jgi:cytochrome c oxidase cbb3-type subunit 3